MSIIKYIHRSKRTTTTPSTTGFGFLYNSFAAQQRSVRFGALYNRYAISNIAGTGWHMPTHSDALSLMEYSAGQMMSVNSVVWDTVYATDAFGFAAVGGGYRRAVIGYSGLKDMGAYWIETDDTFNFMYFLFQGVSNEIVFDQGDVSMTDGCSIRLVKDSTLLTEDNPFGTYVGNDGRVYRTCLIDGKEWMAENLCETKYNDGTSIPVVENLSSWGALTTGGMCYYDNDISNESDFLIAADGWRLAFESEWSSLTPSVSELKSDSSNYWDTPGTDDYNFGLRGSGTRSGSTGNFSNLKTEFKGWCADKLRVVSIDMDMTFSTVSNTTGASLRLVKENPTTAELAKSDGEYCDNYTGNDGQTYPTIKLDGKVWLAMNLQETRFRPGATIQSLTANEDWTGVSDNPAVGDDYEGGRIFSVSGDTALIISEPIGDYTFEEAVTEASASDHEGFTDWILPTIDQWETVFSVRDLMSTDIQNLAYWTRTEVDEFSVMAVDVAVPESYAAGRSSIYPVALVRTSQLNQQPAYCVYDNSASNLIEIDNIVTHNGMYVTHNGDYVTHS